MLYLVEVEWDVRPTPAAFGKRSQITEMAVVSSNATPPVQTSVALTPALKQARGPQNVKTDTIEAVDAPDGSGIEPKPAERRRGDYLDILV